MPETITFVILDAVIIGLVGVVIYLLARIERNTRKPHNKDLFQK